MVKVWSREDGRPDVELGTRKKSARFDSVIAFDAALVHPDAEALDGVTRRTFWRRVPTVWAKSESVVVDAQNPAILTKQGDTIPVDSVKTTFGEEMAYEGIGIVRITEVLLLRVRSPQVIPPRKGDSGSPILSGGTLLGMHIGMRRDGETAIAIPAYQLFGTMFSPRIELASDAIG